jgi:hypothetical protein
MIDCVTTALQLKNGRKSVIYPVTKSMRANRPPFLDYVTAEILPSLSRIDLFGAIVKKPHNGRDQANGRYTCENVVRRIGAECAHVDESGGPASGCRRRRDHGAVRSANCVDRRAARKWARRLNLGERRDPGVVSVARPLPAPWPYYRKNLFSRANPVVGEVRWTVRFHPTPAVETRA